MKVINLTNGYVKVRRMDFIQEFMEGGIIPEDLYWLTEDSKGYISFPKYRLDELEAKRVERKKRTEKLYKCVELNNKGIKLEKQGKISEAISVYEDNIKGDCYPARHSFDRLLVLYRKAKDYESEKRVAIKAISLFPETKYKERLKKIELLISKQNKS
ncbi:hypothetical protein [Prevotella sp. KH2C16]|uniref:hypothetical protein n=1 Tax=Prevotella sp. KH2C16 TaxID=1855325 RepID=UPI000B8054EC|nr:hypothetical protein [Prevotella sp. KH2C16]